MSTELTTRLRERLLRVARAYDVCGPNAAKQMLGLLWPVIEATQGCSDNYCKLRKNRVGTNGGCRCADNISKALAELERAL